MNNLDKKSFPLALNFTRENLSRNYQNVYHHIGIYAYKVSALETFINLDQTNSEKKNKLEQLRALNNNMSIHVGYIKTSPPSYDTEEDLIEIRKLMKDIK